MMAMMSKIIALVYSTILHYILYTTIIYKIKIMVVVCCGDVGDNYDDGIDNGDYV